MENTKPVVLPVILKGGDNYILWSRTAKAVLCGRGLWNHIESSDPPTSAVATTAATPATAALTLAEESKWYQEDQAVLAILHGALDVSVLEAYSYCEKAKELWDTLKNVFGNVTNLTRVFEVKRALNNLSQDQMDFTKFFGKFRSLWAELEMLRPATVEAAVLNERREQDKVFALLMVLNPAYNDLIKHLLRADKLPNLEEVCAQIQKEQGSLDLFGNKGSDLVMVNKAEQVVANKGYYRPPERRSNSGAVPVCEHCKLKGHTKDRCYTLHPHLRPKEWKNNRSSGRDFRDSRAHLASEAGGSNNQGGTISAPPAEYVTKSDLDALVKALKDSGNSSSPISFHASCSKADLTLDKPKSLIVDSGASHHMISDLNLIRDVKPALGHVSIANGDQIPIEGIGNLQLFDKESQAFYMPSFTSNLLSIKKATTDLNCYAIFGPNEVAFQDIETSRFLGQGTTKDGLYVLEDTRPSSLSCGFSFNVSVANDVVWHARLGHPHHRALNLLLPNVKFQNHDCEACILGKHCRTVFPKSATIYDHCFDLIHSDVWTSPCFSRENHKYFVTFIDEKSKYTWLTLLPSKDRVLEAFISFHAYVTNHYNAKVKVLRSDNGGEYMSHAFKNYMSQHGIIHQTSCPYTPQQNGVAERKNRHLMEVARSMMFHTNVPKKFWGDAVTTACYLINRTPTKILHDLSPFEVLTKAKPSIDHLRVFGCVCFVLVPGENRNKLDAKSLKSMFIGYSSTQKGYKCLIPDTGKVLVSRDVKFLEQTGYYTVKDWESLKNLPQSQSDRAENLRRLCENLGITPPSVSSPASSSASPLAPEGENVAEPESASLHNEATSQNVAEPESASLHDQATSQNDEHVEDAENEPEEPPVVELRRSQRLKKDPSNWVNTRVYYNCQAVAHPTQAVCSLAYFPGEHQVFMAALDQHDIPQSYEEAIQHEVWTNAVGDEIHAMIKNHTWDETDLPKGKKTVSSKWVFTIKYLSNGEIERHKARLVARGFTQTYGQDYKDTFAPVAKLPTVRVILSLAVNLQWELWQMDVKNAFLQGELDEEVYMTPPPGLEHMVQPGKVLKLRKAIYGLKQSPRAWYRKLSVTLLDHGFRRSESDHTLFILQSQSGIIVILVYVDDIIISGNDKVGIQETKAYLKSMFEIKDLGELKYFLGIEVCRSKEGLFLSQRKYTLDLVNETGMSEAKPAKTPLEEAYKTHKEMKNGEDQPFEDAMQYRRIVGKLIYLTLTRPDICFAVNQVSQYMQSPTVYHWAMVERILRYLKGSAERGIWMGCNGSSSIVGYCDADWAGDRGDRKSTSGYCTFVGGNLVTWKSKKQKVVSLSSTEAEYRAMRRLTTELMWLKMLLEDLGRETPTPITMHCDNQAAIHIASNSVFHERTKHIEVDCHKVREQMQLGVILPCYTRSEDQLADIFTKAATKEICESIHERLGLVDLDQLHMEPPRP